MHIMCARLNKFEPGQLWEFIPTGQLWYIKSADFHEDDIEYIICPYTEEPFFNFAKTVKYGHDELHILKEWRLYQDIERCIVCKNQVENDYICTKCLI